MINLSVIFVSFILFLFFSFLLPKKSKSKITIVLLAGLALLGAGFVIGWLLMGCPSFLMKLTWYSSGAQDFLLSFSVDKYFMVFGCVALYVTWSIMEFSHYYMDEDPKKQSFLKTLILFLFFMLLLVCSKSLFLLFVGWEGVGILSFILMGWWFTRKDAGGSALQAILYNRMGDSGMILFMLLAITQLKSWNLNEMLFLKYYSSLSGWALMGMIVAATGKSAQFSLHPWLPAAMEGPTPVSALLHSSTMVVAGVFLLVRTSDLLGTCPWSLKILAVLGAVTALFAASAALSQFDIKKVVAYSTTSQLGLMVACVGLGLPWLALFHICTHAFFKALLFLCSGSLIHALKKEQDMRKMGNSGQALPFTAGALLCGSLALGGIPFLAGFYSKDLILEAAQSSLANQTSVVLSLMATLMTALYSARVIYFLIIKPLTSNTTNPVSEKNHNLILSFIRLLAGALTAGWILTLAYFDSSSFIVPLLMKSLPLLVSMGGALYMFTKMNPASVSPWLFSKLKTFTASNWFFTLVFHGKTFRVSFLKSMSGVLRILDQGWTSQLGPVGWPNLTAKLTIYFQKAIVGNITQYLGYLLVLSMVLTMLSFS